ncbi:MAG TPA: PASTA domain-containing protein [Acidimicrobiales bacterium]|jgi:beta-lactam-binding protein with PASTA domain/tRNA A-37 threonylcarbamoyl transferase component Bud32|nr:PASTA domain-containing protein [Acidimicrobiales bacterium]
MPLISDSIGRVLGKRYRLLSALGTGASAHVYLAEDVSLQRHVAVKVLQPGLAADEAFLKRFRAEARSVASLNHPHVLRVFDWGEDNDEPYLVLEYLGGGSLRDLLDRDVRLTHAQAAVLGADVAQGLAYAHVRGLVHRDVKPANLLFDEEGRVRIADFGVARALAEAAWTEPAGAMVGTARYISPEAAEGKSVDGRADVYSLALVLYEAVTGTVPFVTDTTMGTLAARIGQPLPHDPALGPLDDVLARAAAPDVSARLDAAGLSARLGALAAALPTPAPLPLVFPHLEKSAPIAGFQAPGVGELTDTGVAAAAAAAAAGAGAGGTTVVGGGTMVAAGAPVGTKAGPGEVFDAEAFGRSKGAGGPMPPGAGPTAAAMASSRGRWWKRRRTWVIAGICLAVVLLAAGLAVAFGTNVLTPSHPTPALANLTVAEARTSLSKVHMTLAEGTPIKSITVGSGDIVSQDPKAGVSSKEGTTVTVVVSDGPPNVTVPNLSGMTCPQATNALTAAHFKSVCAPGAYNNSVQAGVLDIWTIGSTQNPTKAPYGSTITLVPSLGHQPATVPQIPQTYSFAQAQAALQAVGLTATQNNQSSTTVPNGDVIGTSPASGAQAPYGSAVTVNVSTGPPTVQVPNVQDDTVQQATNALQSAGLSVSGVSGNPSNNVVGTQPSIGSTVPTGSAVQLFTH